MRFELFVAARYLRARRMQAVIGVITAISVVGFAAGVAALIIALATPMACAATYNHAFLAPLLTCNSCELRPTASATGAILSHAYAISHT